MRIQVLIEDDKFNEMKEFLDGYGIATDSAIVRFFAIQGYIEYKRQREISLPTLKADDNIHSKR